MRRPVQTPSPICAQGAHLRAKLSPIEWALDCRYRFGNALSALGRAGERDRNALSRPSTAFTEAPKERTRERVPLDLATTQNNLGAAP